MRKIMIASTPGIAVSTPFVCAGGVIGIPMTESFSAGISPCDWECDYCWCGTWYEQNCPVDWFYDAECDCGCQFCDGWCDCSIQDCGLSPCAANCDWCFIGTPWDLNCPSEWQGDGDCDCGCQFVDTLDCGGGGLPDLAVLSTSVNPTTGVSPGSELYIDAQAWNQGIGTTGAPFDLTWFISTDTTVNLGDLAWAYSTFQCCLGPTEWVHAYGPAPWPDHPVYTDYMIPGRTYYL
ncbi:MAG: hypothetical protein PVI86_06365, partial [Phycisphaerae bacterium]